MKSNFKALFIIPSQEKVYGIRIEPKYAPLGVLYVSAVLQALGADVTILDMDADRLSIDEVLRRARRFNPDMFGITAITPVINEAFNISRSLKERFDKPIILGGIHATMNPEECIKNPFIDFVVKGEGENTVKELVLEMMKDKSDFSKVKGLYYKKGGNTYFTGERDLIKDLDTIPFPARELLGSLSKYKPPDAEHMPVASIMTTRGCPGRCTYCCTQNIFKNRYRMRSMDNVTEEIEDLIGRFKVREIHIADDAFNVNRKRVLGLCEAIRKKKYGINFEFLNGLRADMIDEEILEAFKSIGVRNVGFGIESADTGILRSVKKNIMPEQVKNAIRLAQKKGFKTWAFFMIGLPGETASTVKKSIEFAKEINPDFAKFLIFKPFPGSVLSNEIKEKGLIDDFNFDNYGVYTPPVHHLENLTKDDLLYWQKRAFREFYFRPKKIWSHLKRQRSFLQLKLSIQGLSFVCFNAFRKGRRCPETGA